jgi:peptidoglycan hydrolase FlgJ
MDISSINDYSNSINKVKNEQYTDKNNAFKNSLEEAVANGDKEGIKNACVEFESYFLQLMFKEMRKTDSSQGIFVKGQAEKLFQDMLDEENSKSYARAGGIGLAEMMIKNLEMK